MNPQIQHQIDQLLLEKLHHTDPRPHRMAAIACCSDACGLPSAFRPATGKG